MNIGLDFGTTYSVISRVNKRSDATDDYSIDALRLKAANLKESISSLVVKDSSGNLVCGRNALGKMKEPGSVVYRGFKMMLTEKSKQKRHDRGYDEVITPEKVTEIYIRFLFDQARACERVPVEFDKVVVGVPAVWFDSNKANDSRVFIEDIVKENSRAKMVEVISEPELACAYFTDNYYKNRKEHYNGKILLVDYGGGTLDLSLCDVKYNGERCEITLVRRSGAGISDGSNNLGSAGLAFIEKILELVCKRNGIEMNNQDKDYYDCINDIEGALIEGTDSFFDNNKMTDELVFSYVFDGGMKELLEETFCDIYVSGENYNITYGDLKMAYDVVINPVLKEKLDDMKEYIDAKKIENENLKIAMVGGFCNFYLTQKQICKSFSYGGMDDPRFKDMMSNVSDCEKAISYGAALVAEGVIDIKRVAPYHIGFASMRNGKLDKVYYAVHKGDVIAPDKVYWRSENFSGRLRDIVINRADTTIEDARMDIHVEHGELDGEYLESLDSITKADVFKFGISLDKSLVITVHVRVQKQNENGEYVDLPENTQPKPIRLGNIDSILGSLRTVK